MCLCSRGPSEGGNRYGGDPRRRRELILAGPDLEQWAPSRRPARAVISTATQTMLGRGAVSAEVMLVGKQPGDNEDKQGVPFMGPASRLLDQALDEAGILNPCDTSRTSSSTSIGWRAASTWRFTAVDERGSHLPISATVSPRGLDSDSEPPPNGLQGVWTTTSHDHRPAQAESPTPLPTIVIAVLYGTLHSSAIARAVMSPLTHCAQVLACVALLAASLLLRLLGDVPARGRRRRSKSFDRPPGVLRPKVRTIR